LDVPDLFASFWIKPKKRRTAPLQNRSVKKVPVTTPNQKKHRTDALSQLQTTFLRAPARTSTGEQRPRGLADWMFLIFLLLFGSSQKEGERLHQKTVQSKTSGQSNKSTEPTLSPFTTNFPTCPGPGQSSMPCGILRRKWANQGKQQVGGLQIRTIFVRDALRYITDSTKPENRSV
jgi:hypothetical protein